MKTVLRAKRRIEVEFPGTVRVYSKGQEIRITRQDKLTDKGLYMCWGHGGYSFIPREAFEVVS